MSLEVDLFWSFRSPYSYLAIPKTLKLVAEYDLVVNARPVYPLAVRVPDFFSGPIRNSRGTSCSIVLAWRSLKAFHSAFRAPIQSSRTWRRSKWRPSSREFVA